MKFKLTVQQYACPSFQSDQHPMMPLSTACTREHVRTMARCACGTDSDTYTGFSEGIPIDDGAKTTLFTRTHENEPIMSIIVLLNV